MEKQVSPNGGEKYKAKVIWLSGNMHDRKLTLAEIKGQFVSAEHQIIDGEYSVAFLEQMIRQDSVFSTQKLVIIREMPKPTSTRATMVNQLKKLLDDIPDDCLVVFNGIRVSDEKAISAHVKKIGKVFEYTDKIEPHSAVPWLQSVFTEMGKEISVDDAKLLIETSGHDTVVGGIGADLLRTLATKICLYVGTRKKRIDRADVTANIFPSEDVIIWKMFDALDSKDLTACYNAFHKLVEREQSVIGAVNLLYSISMPRYRLLMFLKEGIGNGKSKQEVSKDAVAMLKCSQQGVGWRMKMIPDIAENGSNAGEQKVMFNQFAVDAALNGSYGKNATVDNYSRKEIIRIVNCITSGLPELRARGSSDAAMSILADVLFLSACTQVDDNVLGDMRKSYGYTL